MAPTALDAPAPEARFSALCLHGLGLGGWLFEPWVATLHAAGISVRAPTFPGHGDGRDVGFADLVEAAEAELQALLAQSLPVVLIGHSIGGLVAQVLLSRHAVHAGVLVCPMPPGQIASLPALSGARWLPESVMAMVAGRPYLPSWGAYRALGLNMVEEQEARAFHARVTPWPRRLCRDLLRPPTVDATKVESPVLVALGGRDPMVRWQKGRLLGDLYEAVVWRYDDLSHSPTHEPGGLRMARDIAAFCALPRRPQVIESEGYTPSEGVGGTKRRERRGEAMKRRSAYGQKKAAR